MKKLFLSILLAIVVMAVNAQETSSLVRVKKHNSQNTTTLDIRENVIHNQSTNEIQHSPKTIAAGEAIVTLVAGDIWGDGTGYQLLLDATASTYGNTIPATGPLSTSGDVPASTYNKFAYKIPTNADGALNTTHIVVNDSVSITIPAGTYDYCITNPSPMEGVMWIATGTYGRKNDFVFEEGEHYVFKIIMNASGENDQTILTISGNPAGINNLKTKNASLQVYPNPATNQLTIDNGNLKIGTIELLDFTGRSIFINKVNTCKTSLDISTLPTGIYMLKVDGKTTKVVKN